MRRFLGQAIDGREMERAANAWSGERFASFCDSLVWTVSRCRRRGLPSFTFNTNAPDGGVDAEYFDELPEAPEGQADILIGAGWNVFQYKKRDVVASGRKKVVNSLKSQLKGVLTSIEKTHSRRVSRYILCVNVNLEHKEKMDLREAIMEGFPRADQVVVAVLGAQDLAQLLNDNPHLLAAYFHPLDFRTWEAAFEALGSRKFLGLNVALIGRDETLRHAISLVEDSRVRVVALWGPHDIGKSRLALEATYARMDSVVVAADPQELTATDLRALVSPHQETICIAEDPDPKRVDALIQEALAESNLKLVLTIPSPSHAPKPSYGTDDRVQHVEVAPLSREESRKLIAVVSPNMPFTIEDWIVEKSGGVPGIILAAAAVGEGLSVHATDFKDRVGEKYAKRIETTFGPQNLKVMRLFSLLTHVGIAGTVATEAGLLRELFGEGIGEEDFREEVERLLEAGILRRRGSFVEVAIPFLANYLAGHVVSCKKHETLALFARLRDTGRIRLVRRFGQLEESVAGDFWGTLFGKDGLLSGEQILDNMALLEVAAGAAPQRTLSALKALFEGMSVQRRLEIEGDQRRGLIHALEQLLFRAATSSEALRLMGLLAEAENESYGNNATGVFAECFLPYHPQMPLHLEKRLEVLREFASKPATESRRVALRGIDEGTPSTGGMTFLRHAEGPDPFDRPPPMTHGEIWDYMQGLLEVAWEFAEGHDDASVQARAQLPDLVARLGLGAPPQLAVEWFGRLVEISLSPQIKVDVSKVSDALRRVLQSVEDRLAIPDLSDAASKEVSVARDSLQALVSRLESAVFEVRLRRWLGGGNRFVQDETEEEAVRALAEETVSLPHLMTEEVWEWLLSSAARRAPRFYWLLGRHDSKGLFQRKIESAGASTEGADVFSSYWGGWAERDYATSERRLDELAAADLIDGKAVVLATWHLKATEAGIERIISQLRRGRVLPEFVADTIEIGSWMDPLNSITVEPLFVEIAGQDLRNGSSVVNLLGMWLRMKKPLEGRLEELAWRILEADPPIRVHQHAWDCDQLAAYLASKNLQRGFGLLKRLAGSYRDGKWVPLEYHGMNRFWQTLCSRDRARALEIVIRAVDDPRRRYGLEWALKGLLSPREDRETILALARESAVKARFLAGCLTAGADGFWALAGDLMTLYPDDDKLWLEIAGDIAGLREVISGSQSDFLEKRKQEVESVLADPASSAPLRRRLKEWLERVEERIGRHLVWEYDEDIGGLIHHVRDKGSSQRIWAIGRILKYATFEEIRKLLSPEDIEEALPQVDVPEERRRTLEAALPIWKYGQ